LVDKKLLCVFVKSDEEVQEVVHKVRGRLSRYQREEPIHEWLDIRGIGESCEDLINTTVDELEDEFIGIDYDTWQGGEDLVVRVHPRSLQPISQ